MLSKVVAKKKNGSMLKGTTGDFLPYRSVFHINVEGFGGRSVQVEIDDLKAVFFVKHLSGGLPAAPHIVERPPPGLFSVEHKVVVMFHDAEVIEGYTHSFHMDRLGFFMTPADPADNNERIFPVMSSIKSINVDGRHILMHSSSAPLHRCSRCGKVVNPDWLFCPFDGSEIAAGGQVVV